jgi:hypothetical protein
MTGTHPVPFWIDEHRGTRALRVVEARKQQASLCRLSKARCSKSNRNYEETLRKPVFRSPAQPDQSPPPRQPRIVLYSIRYFTPGRGICKGGCVFGSATFPENYLHRRGADTRRTTKKTTWNTENDCSASSLRCTGDEESAEGGERFTASYLTRS